MSKFCINICWQIIEIKTTKLCNSSTKQLLIKQSFTFLLLTFCQEDSVKQVTCGSVSSLGRRAHANAGCLLRAWCWASDLRVGVQPGQARWRKRGVFVKGVVLSKWLAGRCLAWAGALTQTRGALSARHHPAVLCPTYAWWSSVV